MFITDPPDKRASQCPYFKYVLNLHMPCCGNQNYSLLLEKICLHWSKVKLLAQNSFTQRNLKVSGETARYQNSGTNNTVIELSEQNMAGSLIPSPQSDSWTS